MRVALLTFMGSIVYFSTLPGVGIDAGLEAKKC